MSKDKLKELFHSQLYNHEVPVQPADWDIISERLDKKRRRKAVPMFYFYSISGVVAVLLLGLFMFNPKSQNTTTDITANADTQNVDSKLNVVDKETEIADSNIAMKNKKHESIKQEIQNNMYAVAGLKQKPKPYFEQDKTIAISNDYEQIIDTNRNEKLIPEENLEKSVEVAENQSTEPVENRNKKQQNTAVEWWNVSDNELTEKKNDNSWSLALVSWQNIGSNTAISGFPNNIWANGLAVQSDSYNPIWELPLEGRNTLSATPYANLDKIKDMKHKRPISIGIRIKKNINEKIRLKTGLSYSYFMSELDATDVEIKQKIHYIGIPIGAEFLLWNKSRFNLYVSSEFIVEKGVSYYLSSVGRTIIGTTDVFVHKGSVRGLQFSANAGVGISYDVAENFGIYAEPNVTYYIKDNRQTQSFRTENPLNIGLNIGLKYNF